MVTHSEAILATPTLETDTDADTDTEPACSESDKAQLIITASIAIGAARGAQLVAVTVTPRGKDTASGKSYNAVEKIYDPLYYSFESMIGHHPEDCVCTASHDYVHEARAYEHLRAARQTGSFAPEYYGSWRFNLPISIRGIFKTRSVSLIPIEHLDGNSLLSTCIQNNPDWRQGLDSFHYPEGFRLEVLARAMEGYVRLLRAGVVQRDFAARNLVLIQNSVITTKTADGYNFRVVLVDYNRADILDDSAPDEVESLPINPARVFWREYIWHEFPGWVPHEWEDIRLQHYWLLNTFTKPGQRELYLPVQDLEVGA